MITSRALLLLVALSLVSASTSAYTYTTTRRSTSPGYDAHTFVPTDDVRVVASPSAMHDGFTKHLFINCTFFHGPRSDFSSVMSLIVSKTATSNDYVYSEIATITAFSSNQVDVKKDLGATVTGHLQANSQSFIAMQWLYPRNDVEGRYKCEAYGMDKNGHPRVSSAMAIIKEQAVNFDMVLHKMEGMDTEIDALNAYRDSMTSRLDDSLQAITDGRVFYQGGQYVLSKPFVSNVAMAGSLCRLFGGYLLQLNNPAEYTVVSQLIRDYSNGDMVAVGATDEAVEGTWNFLQSGTAMSTSFLEWASQQPDGGRTENCLYLSTNRTSGLAQAYDDLCSVWSVDRFVCEIRP
ncbi:uncharacterized protein LOC101846728 [Aplysia californica]|uniref:Uncharacterized protein LOC101846728 n=1 Tax=Aplysia californica TaxID=6500 RepID=A0ABM0ZXQ2_APLCA|nr:uncharacterized protein LOC101846728 [Aplysia californica]